MCSYCVPASKDYIEDGKDFSVFIIQLYTHVYFFNEITEKYSQYLCRKNTFKCYQ